MLVRKLGPQTSCPARRSVEHLYAPSILTVFPQKEGVDMVQGTSCACMINDILRSGSCLI